MRRNWIPTQKDNFEIIINLNDYIKEKLIELKAEVGCPDSFVYNFFAETQQKWTSNTSHSLARNNKMEKNNPVIIKTSLKISGFLKN